MELFKRESRSQEYDITDQVEAEVGGIRLLLVENAAAAPMPETVGGLWSDSELDQLAEEQEPLWQARGEAAAQPATVRAAGLDPAAKAAQTRIGVHDPKLRATVEWSITVQKVLGGLTRREPRAKFWYVLRFVSLVLGDVAGVAGAAILLGEIVWLAVMQAVAAGVAAVSAGIVGQDIRDMVLSRRRRRDEKKLSAEEQPFRHLFQGAHAGEGIIKIMVGVAVMVAILTVSGIFALRSGVEGPTNGVVFAGLAGAICLASALNSYIYADEVADLIDRANRAAHREGRRHQQLANHRGLRRSAKATAAAQSIKQEHQLRGVAAMRHILALKWRVYRHNPAIVGHGPQPNQPSLNGQAERRHADGARHRKAGGGS
jgi:hypothetical protein